MDDKKASRIAFSSPFDGFNESTWPEMVAWLCDHIVRLEAAFAERLKRLNPRAQVRHRLGELWMEFRTETSL